MAQATEWFEQWAQRIAHEFDAAHKDKEMHELAMEITDEVMGQGHYMRSNGLPDIVIEEEP